LQEPFSDVAASFDMDARLYDTERR